MKTLSIIVPTLGRLSLIETLGSFAVDLHDEDHVYVIPDGRVDAIESLVEWFRSSYRGEWIVPHGADRGTWGHPLRNHVLPMVTTDLVWTIDDDDVAAPGALDVFREQEDDWRIYKMTFGKGHPAKGITCWRQQVLQHGDIGTPMIVAKPCGARFGMRYEGDWDYVTALNEELGEPAWDERVIAIVRP